MKAACGSVLAAVALAAIGHSALAEPRVTVISQWSAGAEGAAMNALGALVEKAGAKWQHTPVSGFTTDMMNKLRAEIIGGHPPAASQLKGPEIREWSRVAPMADLDADVAAADFAKLVSPSLAKLSQPNGHWNALPLQVYRVNTFFASKKAMDRIGATALPHTWDEFNAMAEKMAAAGITPLAHGGLKWADAMDFEIVLAGMNPVVYHRALMDLDDSAIRGPEVLAAFRELRRMTGWMDPANAGQHWSVFVPQLMRGEYGFLMMGGWASGVLRRGNFEEGRDFLCGPTPNNTAAPVFDINADSLAFWKTSDPDLAAGQKILADVVMGRPFAEVFTQINGSIPVRSDISVGAEGYQPCQRDAAAELAGATEANQAVLSLAHNMAQPNPVTSALLDVLTEFVHNPKITPEQGQQQLADAADSVR
jgi:glucose/mannose transport system substrate-binding protein